MSGWLTHCRRPRGFTVIELMITLVVLSILLGVGIPSFRNFIDGQKLRATSAALRVAISTARSEAIKRNTKVELEADASGWSSGWTIPHPISTEPDILSHAVTNGVTVSLESGAAPVFSGTGRTTAAEFELSSGASYVSCLTLGLQGRVVAVNEAC